MVRSAPLSTRVLPPAAGGRIGYEVLLFFWLAGLLLVSCRSSQSGFKGGPVVTAVDSVALQEPDSAAVGRFANVTHDRLGRTYLADLTRGRIIRFNRNGTFDRTIGRSGAGPGELQAAGQPGLLANDSILAVPDPGQSAISLFEAATGRFLRRTG